MANTGKNMIPILSKVKDAAEVQSLVQAAQDDDDGMIFPTHGVYKNGQIAGAWSIASIPLALCWHKRGVMTAKDSLIVRATVDAVLNSSGANRYFLACNNESPFLPHMEKFGFTPIWPTNLFSKNI